MTTTASEQRPGTGVGLLGPFGLEMQIQEDEAQSEQSFAAGHKYGTR